MSKRNSKIFVAGLSLLSISSAIADTTGNRYGYPVLYESEISAASAWLHTSQNKWNKAKPHAPGIEGIKRKNR